MARQILLAFALLASPLPAEEIVKPFLGGRASHQPADGQFNIVPGNLNFPSQNITSWGTWDVPGGCCNGEESMGFGAYELPVQQVIAAELIIRSTGTNRMPTVVMAPPVSLPEVDHVSEDMDVWRRLALGDEIGSNPALQLSINRYGAVPLDSVWLNAHSGQQVLFSIVNSGPPGLPATSSPFPFLLFDYVTVPGDANQDGSLNNLDITPFAAYLVADDAARMATQIAYEDLAGLPWREGWLDVNGDGAANNLDIAPFAAALTGGAAAVPEPPGAVLILIALCLLIAHRSIV